MCKECYQMMSRLKITIPDFCLLHNIVRTCGQQLFDKKPAKDLCLPK